MLLAVMSLVGCGGEKKPVAGGNKGNANNGIDAASEEEYFMDMPSELKGTTVKFATWIDHSQTDTAAVLAGFEQTTGMKYEMVSIPQSEYFTKLAGLIASDQAPDVVVDNWEFPRSLNCLMPLTVEETGLDVTDPFWNQDLVKVYTVGKYCYLVNGASSSWDIAGGATYFNKSVLEDNGIKTPTEYVEDNNWNLSTLYTMMTQVKKSCGFTNAGTAISLDVFTAMHGARELTWNSETGKFENTSQSEEMKAALKYLLEAQEAGLARVQTGESTGDFATGKGAVELCGAYGLRNKPGWFYEMDLNDLGVTVLPKINADDADYPYTTFPRAYGICKGSKNAKGAAYFLRYFLNDANYDMDAMFKTEECKELYLMLREKSDYNRITFSRGLYRLHRPEAIGQDHMQKDALKGTAAQLNVSLASMNAVVEACANTANQYVADFLSMQE